MKKLGALLAGALVFASAFALAHPMAPASLRIELENERHGTAELRVPSGAALEARLPLGCAPEGEREVDPGGSLLRMKFSCARSFYEGPLAVAGLEAGDRVLVFVEREDGTVFRTVFDENRASVVLDEPAGALEVALDYFLLGIDHLITGWDHVLFVIGLAFLVGRSRPLVFAVTAFTLGHSLTLAALSLGLATVPEAPVEIGIALTLVYLAVELVDARRAERAARSSITMAFVFGLLHGLGFAGALAETGLPETHLLLALFTFNVGIEVGQLAVLAALGALALAFSRAERLSAGLRAAVPYVVGGLGAYAVIERVVGTL
jgi:hydrogenase/urease accessory protein HupE